MRYELIMEHGDVALIVRKNNLDEYAVVRGLNKDSGEWDRTLYYCGFGSIWGVDKADALARALDCFRYKTEEGFIPRPRLEEIATKAIDGLYEDDPIEAEEYLLGEMEMEEYEMEFFGRD